MSRALRRCFIRLEAWVVLRLKASGPQRMGLVLAAVKGAGAGVM